MNYDTPPNPENEEARKEATFAEFMTAFQQTPATDHVAKRMLAVFEKTLPQSPNIRSEEKAGIAAAADQLRIGIARDGKDESYLAPAVIMLLQIFPQEATDSLRVKFADILKNWSAQSAGKPTGTRTESQQEPLRTLSAMEEADAEIRAAFSGEGLLGKLYGRSTKEEPEIFLEDNELPITQVTADPSQIEVIPSTTPTFTNTIPPTLPPIDVQFEK